MSLVVDSDMSVVGRDFIAHYGVKGMKWGVRRARPSTDVSVETRINTGLRGVTKIKAQGGMSQPASPDAIKAAIQKQKMKKSGTAALSNKELQELANRMQLEVNVKRLSAETASGGQKFVRSLVKDNAARTARAETTSFVDRVVQEAKTKKK